MKYWNKDKKIRLSTWAVAPAPPTSLIKDAKRWCQLQSSNSKFYFHFTNTRWWFENKEDALFFALTWSGKQ